MSNLSLQAKRIKRNLVQRNKRFDHEPHHRPIEFTQTFHGDVYTVITWGTQVFCIRTDMLEQLLCEVIKLDVSLHTVVGVIYKFKEDVQHVVDRIKSRQAEMSSSDS